MWRNTVAIHSIFFKKTTKLNSQSAQYEKNKIDKDNSGKKIIKNEKKETILRKKRQKQNEKNGKKNM